MNRLAWAFLAACLVLGAAQTIQLSQIVAQPYQGVMVATVGGWKQAAIDSSLQVISGNPPTLHAVGGGSGTQGPQGIPGPVGPVGPQGVQGVQGIQGPPGTSASVPAPPYTVLPTGVANFPAGVSTGSAGQPSKVVLVKPDGSGCTLAVAANGAVSCI